MNKTWYQNFVLGLILLLGLPGCKSATSAGHDPFLGKTRLDPPTTSARSVYVESTTSTQDSGVVPGSANTLSNSAYSSPTQNPSNTDFTTYQTNYPGGLEDVSAPETHVSDAIQNENGHLRWKRIANGSTGAAEVSPADSVTTLVASEMRVPTPEELASYRYFYDFSTFPPRPMTVDNCMGNTSGTSSENPYQIQSSAQDAGATNVASFSEERNLVLLPDTSALGRIEASSATMIAPSATSTPPLRYHSVKLVENQYDPYAPHRQFERKRAALAKNMEAIFDQETESVTTPNVPLNIAQKTPNVVGTRDEIRTEIGGKTPEIPGNAVCAQNGWQVVSVPMYTETAPIIATPQPSIATQVTLPTEKSKDNALPRGNGLEEYIELMDLPER